MAALRTLAPPLGEKMMERKVNSDHFAQDLPVEPGSGNLFHSRGDGAVRGGWIEREHGGTSSGMGLALGLAAVVVPNVARFAQRGDSNVRAAAYEQLVKMAYADSDAAGDDIARGAYVLADLGDGDPEVVLIGTGSEVQHALGAAEQLAADGIAARVVSMPSWEVFAAQDQAYRDEVLPPAVRARVAVEAAATFGWERWVGDAGEVVGMERFGASAPAADLFARFGFTADNVAAVAREVLEAARS